MSRQTQVPYGDVKHSPIGLQHFLAHTQRLRTKQRHYLNPNCGHYLGTLMSLLSFSRLTRGDSTLAALFYIF